ncbi:MAG: phenazine biosynthesis protein PhzF [Gammaproteobacteria bacterium]|nr:MAG: phenazine biosynthesis protein PhzF [Gammaproteobacteria bacterium]
MLDYYIADVFTHERFSGAQIAVFPHAEELNTKQMEVIAKEMNLSETVFISNIDNEQSRRRMRIFTPLSEIDFAGHPVIATAYVLAECKDIELSGAETELTLVQNSGDIDVTLSAENGQVSFVQFKRTVSPVIDRFTPSENELAEILSLDASDIDNTKYTARLVSCGFPYLIVSAKSYEAVRKAKFNYTAWAHSAAPQTAASEILLISPNTPYKDSDFNARLLGPNIGVHEDPPVGSAIPAFAAYLCSFRFTQQGTHSFAVDRGDDKKRRSVLNIEMDHKAQDELALRIGGQAVMVAEGKMHIPN